MGLRVFLMGRVAIEADGSRLDERSLPGRQGRLVFAYLLAEEGRAVPRDELAQVLWGDKPPATWEKALSVLVSKIRALLEEGGVDGQTALRSTYGCYQLVLPVGAWTDIYAAAEALSAAEAALEAGDVPAAREGAAGVVALVRHDFLPGEDGAWAEKKRRQVSEVRVRALECLTDACLAADDSGEAARHAYALTMLEPYRESGYRRLMRTHAATGDNAEALRVYERCRHLLADELGAYPSPETEAAYLEILRAETVRMPSDSVPMQRQSAAVAATQADAPPAEEHEGPHPQPAAAWAHDGRRAHRRRALLVGAAAVLAVGVTLATVPLSEGDAAIEPGLQTIQADRCSPLHYEPAGSPDLLVIADLSLQPGVVATTSPMVDAMTLTLEQRGYQAGPYRVGLQVCDSSTPGNVFYDEETCRDNAKMVAENRSVVGVLGPLTSLCAMQQIPILNRAPGGPVAIVSPSNTYVGLTRRSRGASADEPGVYYPTGQRNYARVVPADDAQAAASVIVARRLGVERVYVLEPEYNAAMVEDFIRAAGQLGIAVAGRGPCCESRSSYRSLATSIARTGADGVFLAGAPDDGSVALLRDLRARLGPDVQIMASDGFDPATAVLAGAAAEGMTISQTGPPNEYLRGKGKQFVATFSKRFGTEPTRFVASAAQSMDVLLDAIARSDGTRASVTRNLFTTRVSNGILGSFWITPTGDTTLNAVGIHRIVGGKVTTFATVIVPDALLTSGLGQP